MWEYNVIPCALVFTLVVLVRRPLRCLWTMLALGTVTSPVPLSQLQLTGQPAGFTLPYGFTVWIYSFVSLHVFTDTHPYLKTHTHTTL